MEGFPPGPYGKVSKYEYSIFIVIWTAPFLKKNKKKVPAGWLGAPRATGVIMTVLPGKKKTATG